jgi:chorismate mutase-like protein
VEKNMDALKTHRAQIDAIDLDLLRLLNRRAELASQVLAVKKGAGMPVCDPKRELEVLARVRDNNSGPLDSRAMETVFRQIIYETRRSEERARRLQRTGHRAALSGRSQRRSQQRL